MVAFTKRLGILLVTLPISLSSSFVPTRRTNVVVERRHPIFSTKTDNAIQTDADLSQMTVVALKDRLRQLSLPLSGRKDDLVKRLLDNSDQQPPQPDTHEPKQEEAARSSEKKEDDDSTIYNNLTVPALKERLRELGLSVGGRKADLIERLLESNDNTHTEHEAEKEDEIEIEASDDDLIHLDLSDDDDENSNDTDRSESSTRRAKRKKFWKTQEVRDLIKQNDQSAIVKAEEMITQLERMAAETGDDEYLPGPIQYTTLIEAYSHGGTVDAAQRAEKVINRLLSSIDSKDANPTTQMLNAIIGAYASTGTEPAAEQATAILEKMEYIKDFGDGTVKPSVHSFAMTINAWSNVGSETAAHNAEEILKRLLEDYDEALEQDTEYAKELKPNNVVFNSVIDAWARSGSNSAGEKAESILLRMEGLSKIKIYDVRPDTITFNTCIKAWCNSGHPDAPLKAEGLLRKLETNPQYPKQRGGMLIVRPNRLSFNTVINSWAKSRKPKSAVYAENLLIRMIKSYQSDPFSTVKPDVITFSSVLNALAKSKATGFKAEKCKSVLNSMITLYEDDGSSDTKPNVICYNTVLNACAFSARGGPDERRKALSVAVETFNELRRGQFGLSPDAVSYGNMLKCCANLMPPGSYRTKMASQLFTSCCNDGLVGGMCLDEIRRCLPPREFMQLLAKCGCNKPLNQGRMAHSVQLSQLPRAFTKNVKAGDLKDRQRDSYAPKKTKNIVRGRKQKEHPVLRRPGLLIEQSWMSGKDV